MVNLWSNSNHYCYSHTHTRPLSLSVSHIPNSNPQTLWSHTKLSLFFPQYPISSVLLKPLLTAVIPSIHMFLSAYHSSQLCIPQIPGPRLGQKPITSLGKLSTHTHTHRHPHLEDLLFLVSIADMCVCVCARADVVICTLCKIAIRNPTTGPPVELIKSVGHSSLNESEHQQRAATMSRAQGADWLLSFKT